MINRLGDIHRICLGSINLLPVYWLLSIVGLIECMINRLGCRILHDDVVASLVLTADGVNPCFRLGLGLSLVVAKAAADDYDEEDDSYDDGNDDCYDDSDIGDGLGRPIVVPAGVVVDVG